MMTTSWFDGDLSKANVNGSHKCIECGASVSHTVVFEDGRKERWCDKCFQQNFIPTTPTPTQGDLF